MYESDAVYMVLTEEKSTEITIFSKAFAVLKVFVYHIHKV